MQSYDYTICFFIIIIKNSDLFYALTTISNIALDSRKKPNDKSHQKGFNLFLTYIEQKKDAS